MDHPLPPPASSSKARPVRADELTLNPTLGPSLPIGGTPPDPIRAMLEGVFGDETDEFIAEAMAFGAAQHFIAKAMGRDCQVPRAGSQVGAAP